ncbi:MULTISPECIES: CrpP-related protein [Achromobacter]|uniref:CrpP-related protein n=1 Tax=Achromobacter aegrifaciens TaxID=1287736 RepID=A0ABU2D8Y8_ACHAE|nr:CrpP-related protein [Achromobacter aegrifaciens]MDR7944575.1 CrpP-related protein [Achromobacter aegrifaciens]
MQMDIQKLGALSARVGLTLLDCPFLRARAMPGHTGERPREWRAKVDAWEDGWKSEVEKRRMMGLHRRSTGSKRA